MARRRSIQASKTEDLVQKALCKVAKGKVHKGEPIWKELGISKATYHRRQKGGKSRAEARECQQLLSRAEEKALIVWITMMAATGNPVSHAFIREMAEEIRRKRVCDVNDENIEHVSYPPIGQQWVQRFLQRYPFMKTCLSKAIEAARIKDMSSSLVLEFFEVLVNLIETYNIRLEDIYNMDETGITLLF